MGRHAQSLCSTRVATRAVVDIGANQANRLRAARAQTPSRCYAAHHCRRGGKAHVVRAAIRHDKTEADELPLVCMVLWQMESRNRVRAVAARSAQDAQLVLHRSSLGASVADQLRIARTVQNGGYFGTVCADAVPPGDAAVPLRGASQL